MGLAAWAGLIAAFAAVVVAIPAIPKDTKGRPYWLAAGVLLLLIAAGLGVAAMRGTENGTTTTDGSTVLPTTAAPPAADVTSIYLDSGRFSPVSGSDRIVDLPAEIRRSEGYRTHPIAISCPTNESGDQSAEVKFSPDGRYRQFNATIHPFYPTTANQHSATHVAVSVAGGTSNNLFIRGAASQNNATPADAQDITADVNEADTMTISVQCGDPAGTVVLTDARLTSS